MQRNRTGDQSQLEVAFPVATHNQLLWFTHVTLLQRRRGVHSARGLQAIAALPQTFLTVAARRCAVASPEGEEAGTTPGGAGDGAGDGGEARIDRALPVEAIERDGDGVALALIVAHQHRAGLELTPARAAVARQTVQEPQAFPIETAKGA